MQALQKMAKQRKDSLDIYLQQGREDLAVIERAELAVIEAFLPAQMSAEEKDSISHRGKSLRAIAPHVITLLNTLG